MFPAALQNVELFEAIVALCLSFKVAGHNSLSPLRNPSFYHKGQALAGIRAKLTAGRVDDAIILATVFLMIIDVSISHLACLSTLTMTITECVPGHRLIQSPPVRLTKDDKCTACR